MANDNFEFAQFPNFAAPINFDELMRLFQTTQAHTEETVKARDQARLEFQQWQEYMDLCTDYRNLFASMMKKLLDADTSTEINKIRTVYNDKLGPLLQKINVIQTKLNGLPTPEQLESRSGITDKFERVKALLEQATQLRAQVAPEPVL